MVDHCNNSSTLINVLGSLGCSNFLQSILLSTVSYAAFCFNFSLLCSPNKDILSNLGFVVMPVLIQYNCTSIPLKATFAKVDNSNFCFCFYFSCHLIFPKQSLLEKTIYNFCIHALFYGTNSYAHNHLITFHIKNS